jgi:hypothetical protein
MDSLMEWDERLDGNDRSAGSEGTAKYQGRHERQSQGRDTVRPGWFGVRRVPPLAAVRGSCHVPIVEKKRKLPLARIHAYAEKLRFLPHLSDDERYLYAYQLAATPDERWQRSQSYLRSVLSSRPSQRRR